MLGIKKRKNKSGVCHICGKPSGEYYICEDCVKSAEKENDEKRITKEGNNR